MQVAAVILAAGSSTRFGSPKQLARVGDRTMLETVAAAAAAGGLGPVIAVVPPGMAVPPDTVPEVNGAPERGLSHSLRLGLAAVPSELGAAIILLGDQPTVTAATIRAVVAAGAANATRSIVAVRAEGRLGPPVLLRRDAFSLAERATGDEGLRSILARHPEGVAAVEVAQHAPDVDTPGDLARIAHMFDSAQGATDR
ncbi:MAG TPA: nucleotidyltransferase family protein [Candidatus Binatia bacterium]|nr:nucleotidyltransferase family protein [Candidatus Binatia bacterium]